MQALWGEPWLAWAPFVDGNKIVTFRGNVSDLWLIGAKQSTADAVKACLSREKTKWRRRPVTPPVCNGSKAAHFEIAEDWIPRFGCLLGAFMHILRILPGCQSRENCGNHNNPRKSKAELPTSIINRRPRALVCGGGERRPERWSCRRQQLAIHSFLSSLQSCMWVWKTLHPRKRPSFFTLQKETQKWRLKRLRPLRSLNHMQR